MMTRAQKIATSSETLTAPSKETDHFAWVTFYVGALNKGGLLSTRAQQCRQSLFLDFASKVRLKRVYNPNLQCFAEQV